MLARRTRIGGAGCGRTVPALNEITTRALVTGGSGGIGAAICRALSAQGHFVYVHAHRGMGAAESIAAEIVSAGGRARALQFDLTDAAPAPAAHRHGSLERTVPGLGNQPRI